MAQFLANVVTRISLILTIEGMAEAIEGKRHRGSNLVAIGYPVSVFIVMMYFQMVGVIN